jgi:DNA-binding NarL/FixJ family response regulator
MAIDAAADPGLHAVNFWHWSSCQCVMETIEEPTSQAVLKINGTIPVTAGPAESFAPNVRVWLVDDNDELRTLVAEVLDRQDGIECARHFSSPDALLSELASKPGPDVILLDVQMGDRNGLDAVRPIKSLTRSTRVLMYTTCFNPEWRERALDEGASDYLLKSYAVERVAARIRCPANDPAPGDCTRRRSNRSTPKPSPRYYVNPAADKSPRLLGRTLEMLRSLMN